MRKINKIVIHCSATPEGRDVDAADIREWHIERGFSGIGYHFIIKLDGTVEKGRDIELAGAHAKGFNGNSIGICYIGGCDKDMNPKDTRTEEQKCELENLIRVLIDKYPTIEKVIGHNEISQKACPSFDVQEWIKEINL